jgi:micrococcal nuclease
VSNKDGTIPFDQHRSRKWTRAGDYLPGSDAPLMLTGPRADLPDPPPRRISRRGLWLPLYALALVAAVLWFAGALDFSRDGAAQPVAEAAATPATGERSRRGVVFGLCDQGGGTNCVVTGDTFFLGGKSVRVAGIHAPATHSARCDAEALLGWAAAERLHSALNGGTVRMNPVQPGRDPNGRLLRRVSVDGRDVGELLVAAGLARRAGNPPPEGSWC